MPLGYPRPKGIFIFMRGRGKEQKKWTLILSKVISTWAMHCILGHRCNNSPMVNGKKRYQHGGSDIHKRGKKCQGNASRAPAILSFCNPWNWHPRVKNAFLGAE